jgi:hypothetical protein
MRHEEAYQRLPDLLDDRDDPDLLAHLRECAECQRQLFLLGRVDRLLRDRAPRRRRPRAWHVAATVAAAAAATVAVVALFVPQGERTHNFVLRSASGRLVGRAVMAHADADNVSLMLTARGLPVNRQHLLVLWAGAGGSSMEVGRFMVDRKGGCRVHFNLPATHGWRRFWVAEPGNAAVVVART